MIKHYLNKLKGKSFSEIIKKVFDKFLNGFINKLYDFKILSVKKVNFTNNLSEFNSKMKFSFDIDNLEYIIEKISDLDKTAEIIKSAELICKHHFSFLGLRDFDLGKDIKWNFDYLSGFEWKNKYFKNIKTVDSNNNADVKIPWELSRFQHLFDLGKAFYITNDKKYFCEFKNQIESWIIDNPYKMSVNWTCAMEVAIRAINWIYIMPFFKKDMKNDKEFCDNINKSLYMHGKYIYENLENKYGFTTNHYMSDLVGLLILGIYFRDVELDSFDHKLWLEYSIENIKSEVKIQINEDGTSYESSTSYHRLVAELLLIAITSCKNNSILLGEFVEKSVEKMCDFIADLTKENGLSPLMGDNDDGRIVILSDYNFRDNRDFRHILAIAGELYDRKEFRIISKDFQENALWLTGKFAGNISGQISQYSKKYTEGGYYFLKNKFIYCLIRCGKLSCNGQGGHSHNDQLSFELNFKGVDLFIDAGVYTYTRDFKKRNLFRSTAMHNTVLLNNSEQNNFNEKNLFEMKEQTFSRCIHFSDNKFIGEHYGYYEKYNCIHRRTIEIRECEVIIEDTIDNLDNRSVETNFILNPEIEIISEESDKIFLKKLENSFIVSIDKRYKITKTEVSQSYGSIIETNKISVDGLCKIQIIMC